MCGVCGVITHNKKEGLEVVLQGLDFLKGRGRDSAGISITDMKTGQTVSYRQIALPYKSPVDEQFHSNARKLLEELASEGVFLIQGQTKYTTSNRSDNELTLLDDTQPVEIMVGGAEAVGIHNGNFPDITELKCAINGDGLSVAQNDTRYFVELFAEKADSIGAESAAKFIMEDIKGSFSAGIYRKGHFYLMRDAVGIRPLSLGVKDDTLLFCSEVRLLYEVRGHFLRHVAPGELIDITPYNFSSEAFQNPNVLVRKPQKFCVMEDQYLKHSHNPTEDLTTTISERREDLGAAVYAYYRPDVDLVVPILNSGRSFGQGFAYAAHARQTDALVKKETLRMFIGREGNRTASFLTDDLRVSGLRLAVTDDSLIRGNTGPVAAAALLQPIQFNGRQLDGAAEVNIYVCSPPILFICPWGYDFQTSEELKAHKLIDLGIVKVGSFGVDYVVEEVNEAITKMVRQDIKDNFNGTIDVSRVNVFYIPLHIFRNIYGGNYDFQCMDGISPFSSIMQQKPQAVYQKA